MVALVVAIPMWKAVTNDNIITTGAQVSNMDMGVG